MCKVFSETFRTGPAAPPAAVRPCSRVLRGVRGALFPKAPPGDPTEGYCRWDCTRAPKQRGFPGALLLWMVVLCALAATWGCRPAPKDDVELTWAVNQHETRSDAVTQFERENPGIHVRIRPISDPRQLFLQSLFGDAPDVITFFQADFFQNFAVNGLLRPLDSKDYEPWPFYAGLKDYCFRRKDGALMALPQVAYPYVLYFNPDWVSREKAATVHTWEDLGLLAGSVDPGRNSAGKKVFGLDIQSDAIWFLTWYLQRGGRLFREDGEKPALDRRKAVATLEAMQQWRSVPGLVPEPGDRLNLPSKGSSQGVLGSLFLQGRAVFYWSGSWKIYDFVHQNRVRWGVLPLPAGPANDLTILGCNSFGVCSRSAHPKEAERFVRYLSGLKGQERHARHSIFMPANPACPVPGEYSVLKDQIGRARTLEYGSGFNEARMKHAVEQMLEAHRLGFVGAEASIDRLMRVLSQESTGPRP